MHRIETTCTTERTAHRPTAPRRRARTQPLLGLVAAATLLVPSAAALAQGEADPAEVVVASLGDATVTLEAFELQAEIVLDDAAIEAGYEANPDQVGGPDGAVPLDEVREPIADLLASEQVAERVATLVAESRIELHPDRLRGARPTREPVVPPPRAA